MPRVSALKARVFGTCRLRFRYQYVDKVRARLRPADTAGSLVHRVLCDFFTKVPPAERNEKMEIRLSTTVQEFKGNGHLESVVVKDLKTGEIEEMRPGAVFVFIGLDPNTQFARNDIDLDRWGFIETSPTLETSIEGIFAAGDARAGSTKQVASAVGEGATAALMIRQFLEKTEGSRGYKGN